MPNWKKVIVSGSNASLNSLTVASGITGTLTGNASTATSATSADTIKTGLVTTNATHYLTYVPDNNLSAAAESLGTVASLTYNPNSGQFNATSIAASSQITAGSISATTEGTLVLGPPPAGGAGEGGQVTLQPASGYTSGSHIDNWQNYTRLLRGTGTNSDAVVAQWNMHSKQMTLPAYTSTSAFAGTAVANLAVNSAGDVITVSTTGGSVFPYTGVAQINGGLGVTGSIYSTGAFISSVNGGMYLKGGDDAEFWDVNIANTVGIYGQQNSAIGGIRLGGSGISITGLNNRLGVGTATPSLGMLEVAGNVYATSVTASLFGTASYATNADTLDGQHGTYYYAASNPSGYTTNTGTVTSVATSGTVSGITLTGGTITTSGTITLGGSISGLTTSNLSATAAITNAQLANSTISGVALGSSLAALTAGSYLTSGGTYTGATARTFAVDATSTNTASKVVARDASGNFSAGTITATLSGNASTATSATTAGSVTNAVTFNNGGTGDASGTTFNGSAARTISYNTIGAPKADGTGASGTWGISISGNAATATSATSATNATNATNVAITSQDTTPITYNITFTGGTSGNNSLNVDATTLTYNPSTTTLTTGTFSGALSGNATTATTATNANNINISATTSTDTTTSVVLVGNQATGNQSPFIDSGLTYNANTNALSATTFVGNLTGNASTATAASSATSAAQVDVITSPNDFAIVGAEFSNVNGNGTLVTENNSNLTYNQALQAIVVRDAISGARTLFGTLNGGGGEGYIEAQGTRMYYYSDRHIFGNNAYGYSGQFDGAGNFDAANDITCGGTKFFDIPHQTKQGWGLKHAAIEGPESGVYFRGKLNGSNEIELPEYWQWLVHKDTITVSLTPVGQYQTLYVKDIKDNKVYIGSDNDYVNCHYVVYGERADVERWDVEYEQYSRSEK